MQSLTQKVVSVPAGLSSLLVLGRRLTDDTRSEAAGEEPVLALLPLYPVLLSSSGPDITNWSVSPSVV